ncbi:cilia- and flagella-associated protein 68 [Rhynchocyon petersi]
MTANLPGSSAPLTSYVTSFAGLSAPCLHSSLVDDALDIGAFSRRLPLVCFLTNPHYGSLINADGHAEVWTDWNDLSKFFQYGWRCTTNENSYSNRTLMGNWNQERYDLKNIVQPKPLPSQDLRKNLIGFQDINLNWILLHTNAQESQLTQVAIQNLKSDITLSVFYGMLTTATFRVHDSKKK